MTKRYLRYALAIIFFANFLSYLDRQVVATMETQLTKPRVEGGLGLTETEFGWVGSEGSSRSWYNEDHKNCSFGPDRSLDGTARTSRNDHQQTPGDVYFV